MVHISRNCAKGVRLDIAARAVDLMDFWGGSQTCRSFAPRHLALESKECWTHVVGIGDGAQETSVGLEVGFV